MEKPSFITMISGCDTAISEEGGKGVSDSLAGDRRAPVHR